MWYKEYINIHKYFFREKSLKYCRPWVNVCYYIRAVLKWQRALVSDVNIENVYRHGYEEKFITIIVFNFYGSYYLVSAVIFGLHYFVNHRFAWQIISNCLYFFFYPIVHTLCLITHVFRFNVSFRLLNLN